jgi:hypothetical protein
MRAAGRQTRLILPGASGKPKPGREKAMSKQPLSSESGATSVLVVFMMTVLVTIGAYSIVSAHVNYSFSQRAIAWNKDYYSCDYLAEGFLKDLDLELAEAERRTADLAISGGLSMDGMSAGEAYEALDEIYKGFVRSGVEKLKDDYPGLEHQEEEREISINFSLGDGANGNLRARIRVAPLAFGVSAENGVVTATKNSRAKRCQILKWEQWQEAQGEAPQELWDGSVDLDEYAGSH